MIIWFGFLINFHPGNDEEGDNDDNNVNDVYDFSTNKTSICGNQKHEHFLCHDDDDGHDQQWS